jgi:hypothetical protein
MPLTWDDLDFSWTQAWGFGPELIRRVDAGRSLAGEVVGLVRRCIDDRQVLALADIWS